jgi:hypothetical protein
LICISFGHQTQVIIRNHRHDLPGTPLVTGSLVRIGDLINLLIPPSSPGSGDGGFSSRGRLAAATPLATSIAPPNQPSQADGDSLDLTSLLASRSGAAAPAFGDDQSQAADPSAGGGRILDAFIRKRAILAYHLPQQTPNGPSIDLTFDVEVAYRVIDVLPAGQGLDTQG